MRKYDLFAMAKKEGGAPRTCFLASLRALGERQFPRRGALNTRELQAMLPGMRKRPQSCSSVREVRTYACIYIYMYLHIIYT